MARDSLSVLAGARGLERRGGRGGPWPEPNARAAPRDSCCTEEVSEARALGPQSCCFVPLTRVGTGAHARGQRLGVQGGAAAQTAVRSGSLPSPPRAAQRTISSKTSCVCSSSGRIGGRLRVRS